MFALSFGNNEFSAIDLLENSLGFFANKFSDFMP